MHIEVNTDHNIESTEGLVLHVEQVVEKAMSHFAGQVTRVEVHLKDENAGKSGAADKRCIMEARVANHQPVAVTHDADNLHIAIEGAASKIKKAVESLLGKLNRK
ncbi:MAG: HPF/RaiA family ribosome-associated protein [Leptospiraceae bacterium]|nr:HPF/RaiA family ribosome-associated protein [Leptospiraceae bacterium]